MSRAAGPRPIDLIAVPVLAALLGWAALFNRFPLIFPDSGTYLEIALARAYAIDRSSFYGFFLKPFVLALPGVAGFWLALAAQLVVVAGVLWLALRQLLSPRPAALAALAAAFLTALPFHAGQFMPDAFTGTTILLTWVAVRRDPLASGGPLLWVAVLGAALIHYTHMPLVLVTAAAALAAEKVVGLPWRDVVRRFGASLVAVGLAAAIQMTFNGAIFERSKVAPLGPLFLYARLNEDGLIQPWLDRHCGRDADARLCALAPSLPSDSQKLLWGGADTPITELVWHAKDELHRGPIIDAMAQANGGAIRERPLAFLGSSISGGFAQFLSFAPLDDECPVGCHERSGGIANTLLRRRPETLAGLDGSRQVTDTMPKSLFRAVIVPVAAIGMILLLWTAGRAWRRKDSAALGLAVAILVGLAANALLAGALSDVHDRYQSRIVWLAPLAAFALAVRFRKRRSAGE